jgi:hypothetical protein
MRTLFIRVITCTALHFMNTTHCLITCSTLHFMNTAHYCTHAAREYNIEIYKLKFYLRWHWTCSNRVALFASRYCILLLHLVPKKAAAIK